MGSWLRRVWYGYAIDGAVLVVLAVPASWGYLQWPMLAIYVALSWHLLRKVLQHRWILWIVNDPRTRICHGLEHATLAVLDEQLQIPLHGFTHGQDRFIVASPAGGLELGRVCDAATQAIARVQAGERSLIYTHHCGTSDLISAATLWVMFLAIAAVAGLLGSSGPVYFLIGGLLLRVWLATHGAIGLLSQRLFTVSHQFDSAAVTFVRSINSISGWQRPDSEVWFEVFIELQPSATQGGTVSPGFTA